jgi:hypothetical protein
MQLHEKYRPNRLEEVVGQDKACAVVRGLMARGLGGRAVWISGASGVGKTTFSRIMGAGKGGRAFIINEAHGLRSTIVRRLLGILERLPAHVLIVFTTTKDGQDALFEDDIDAGPLLSRCVRVNLTNQGLAEAFATRLHDAASAEGLNGRPIADYIKLMRRPDVTNNCRAAFQLIEAGVMIGGVA